MNRLTDNDYNIGFFTFAKAGWNPIRFVFSSGGDEETPTSNNITVYMFGYIARMHLPNIVPDFAQRNTGVFPDGSEFDYTERFPRDYGFCLNDGHLSIYYGAQTHSSNTTKSNGWFLPCTQWRFIRFSLYDNNGDHFYTEFENNRADYLDRFKVQDECPSVSFKIEDYDGEIIDVKTRIEEREWHFGDGWFKWLRFFRKPMIRRDLKIEFSSEVGLEKGSWKGGVMGHGITMNENELHDDAFQRYCNQDHRSKHGKYRIKYIDKD